MQVEKDVNWNSVTKPDKSAFFSAIFVFRTEAYLSLVILYSQSVFVFVIVHFFDLVILFKILKVSYKLRKRAQGPDAEDLEQMGTAVEDFAFHLLDPLKKDDDMRCMLKGQDFDRVIDKAVAFKQMKVL